MRNLALFLVAACLAAPVSAQSIDSATMKRIDRILKRTPLIDGHNDLPWSFATITKAASRTSLPGGTVATSR